MDPMILAGNDNITMNDTIQREEFSTSGVWAGKTVGRQDSSVLDVNGRSLDDGQESGKETIEGGFLLHSPDANPVGARGIDRPGRQQDDGLRVSKLHIPTTPGMSSAVLPNPTATGAKIGGSGLHASDANLSDGANAAVRDTATKIQNLVAPNPGFHATSSINGESPPKNGSCTGSTDAHSRSALVPNLGIMGKRVRRDSSASQVFGSAAVNPECITDESARWAPKSFTRLLHKGLGRRDTAEHSRKKSVEHLRDDDVIIALMGTLKVRGQRSFVDAVLGNETSECRYVQSTNGKIHYTTFPHPNDSNRNVVLVYDLSKDEMVSDTLKCISTWLAQSFDDNKKLSGIIYFADVATSRPSKLSHKDTKVFERYISGSPSITISFVTTGWSGDVLAGERREAEVKESWKAFTQRGANLLRFFDTHESARAIINPIIAMADYKAGGPRKAYRGTESKADDLFMLDPRSTDIVIPIMGPTGVGKSTFINYVAGKPVTTVGHNLKSQTAQLQHVVLAYPKDPNRRIILVDTPGFDDTYVPDSEILRRIGVWLARSYTANMKLSGVIYLHEISQTRMLGTSLKNLDMFNKLCGDEGTKNVILATTKWGEVSPEVGARREQQLKDRHWKPMIDLGSQLHRFGDSKESGWTIIEAILSNSDRKDAVDAIAIQRELVEIDKILPETQAGRTLRYTLAELLESQRQTAAQLRKDQGNPELRDALEENERKIRTTLQQLRAMRVPFARQFRRLNVFNPFS